MTTLPLPPVDEHAVAIEAGVDRVWTALLATLDRTFSRAPVTVYARVVGASADRTTGPRPLATGSTIPGFRVAEAEPGRVLVLEGRHRFSSYALTFRLGADTPVPTFGPHTPELTWLRAESRAAFPGVGGGAYRLLVISTGGHVVGVNRLLAAVKRAAEQRPATGA